MPAKRRNTTDPTASQETAPAEAARADLPEAAPSGKARVAPGSIGQRPTAPVSIEETSRTLNRQREKRNAFVLRMLARRNPAIRELIEENQRLRESGG